MVLWPLTCFLPPNETLDRLLTDGSRGAAAGMLGGWYVSTAKPQINDVNGFLKGVYIRKNWTKPLLIAITTLACYVLIVMFVADLTVPVEK